MIESYCLPLQELEPFLERHKAGVSFRPDVELDVVLRQILIKAYEFVPSESGSILLDDPTRKVADRSRNELVFIATFGKGSEQLVGQRLDATKGIAGQVYQTGQPYLSPDVDSDRYFFKKIDEDIGFKTHSIVAVPIYIGKNVCGVLELINRSDGRIFNARDMTLLEIFAGYTSFTLQKALDARRAHELAKRDDLTGLFNDRWFHVCLSDALAGADADGRECILIFMDLDNFKKVNDTYGHLAGSQVLHEVGFLLKRIVDLPDATVSRYGGDEFVMVLPGTTLGEGVRMAHAIRSEITEATYLQRDLGYGFPPIHLRGLISASLGVARYEPKAGREHELELRKNALLRRADQAMYEAKSRGKGAVVIGHERQGSDEIEFEPVAPPAGSDSPLVTG